MDLTTAERWKHDRHMNRCVTIVGHAMERRFFRSEEWKKKKNINLMEITKWERMSAYKLIQIYFIIIILSLFRFFLYKYPLWGLGPIIFHLSSYQKSQMWSLPYLCCNINHNNIVAYYRISFIIQQMSLIHRLTCNASF